MGYAAGTGAAAAAAALAQAIKASGAIVRMTPEDFAIILSKSEEPLVVTAQGGIFSKNYQYLTSYKGLFFFAKSSKALQLPSDAEVISCKNIWLPT